MLYACCLSMSKYTLQDLHHILHIAFVRLCLEKKNERVFGLMALL